MAKEDSIAELLHDIRSLEEKIEDLKMSSENSNEPLDFSKLMALQDELDDKREMFETYSKEAFEEHEPDYLEKTKTEEEHGPDYVKETKVEEEQIPNNEEEKPNEEQGIEKSDDIEGHKSENLQGIEEQQEMDEQSIADGEKRYTLLDWQIKTGIELIPDEAIKRKYDKFITEKEFKDILANENVPKLLKDPGKAEMYLKSTDDWEGVRTSMSAIDQAIRSGNFPVEVNDESYILLQYDKDTIRDKDDKKDEDGYGYGKIDTGDIYGKDYGDSENESEVSDRDLENSEDDNSFLKKVKMHVKRGFKAYLTKEVLEAAAEVTSSFIMGKSNTALVASIAKVAAPIAKDIGKEAVEKLSAILGHDVKNPNPEGPTIDNEEEFEPQPGGKFNPYN